MASGNGESAVMVLAVIFVAMVFYSLFLAFLA
jgi:hypothetical protein